MLLVLVFFFILFFKNIIKIEYVKIGRSQNTLGMGTCM